MVNHQHPAIQVRSNINGSVDVGLAERIIFVVRLIAVNDTLFDGRL